MNDIYAGDPYLKGKTDSNECMYVSTALDFGVFCSKNATTGDPEPNADGNAIWISGWTTCDKTTNLSQVFWKQAVSIYVRCVASISTGDVLYVASDGSGYATNNPASANVGFIPVGIAKSDVEQGVIDRAGTLADVVKMDWTGLSAPVVPATAPAPAPPTTKKNINKEV